MKKHPVKKVPIILLTVFLALSVFFSACAYVGFDKLITYCSVFVFPTDFSEDHRPFSTYQYDRLNEQEKIAYICILNKIESHPTYIKIPALSRTEFNNVFFAVKNDNPDLLCFSDSCNMIRFLSAGLMEMHYNQDADTCAVSFFPLRMKYFRRCPHYRTLMKKNFICTTRSFNGVFTMNRPCIRMMLTVVWWRDRPSAPVMREPLCCC